MCGNTHKITIFNFKNNQTICYSVALLKGEIHSNKECANNLNLQIINNNNKNYYTSPINNNKFKQLVELDLGTNEIEINYCCSSIVITINFRPKSTNYCVVPIYVICKNHDGQFQSPPNEDNSITSACNRISTAVKLIQCLVAEKFYENGLERKTFQLKSDLNPNAANCRIFYSNFDVETVRKMPADQIWCNIGRELINADNANKNYKYLAFISCTLYRGDKYDENIKSYDDIVKITEGYAALGGGGLAMFGSACLYTWPTNIHNVINCFENETIIDKTKFMDDSCYRGTYGGCFATTLGSVCHELCHTFDLGHTDEGIMGRGFDEINKEFTIPSSYQYEKQHCTVLCTPNINVKITQTVLPIIQRLNPHPINTNKKTVHRRNGIYWTRSCTILLYYHRWLNEYSEHEYYLTYTNNKTIVSSAGISVIEIRNELSGLVLESWDFSDAPKLNFEINKNNSQDNSIIVVQDIAGNILKQKL